MRNPIFIALLISLIFAAVTLPVSAVDVAGILVQIDTDEYRVGGCVEGEVSYLPETNTLILDGVTVDGGCITARSVDGGSDFNVLLKGRNVIDSIGDALLSDCNTALHFEEGATLVITAEENAVDINGDLTVYGGSVDIASSGYDGIYCGGTLALDGTMLTIADAVTQSESMINAAVLAVDGIRLDNCTLDIGNFRDYASTADEKAVRSGLLTYGNMVIADSVVTINAESGMGICTYAVTFDGDISDDHCDITLTRSSLSVTKSRFGAVTSGGSLTFDGCTVMSVSDREDSFAAAHGIIVKDSSVTTGQSASCAFNAMLDDLVIEGSKVEIGAVGHTAIFADMGNVTIRSADVGVKSSGLAAVGTNMGIIIEDSTLTAQNNLDCGIEALDGITLKNTELALHTANGSGIVSCYGKIDITNTTAEIVSDTCSGIFAEHCDVNVADSRLVITSGENGGGIVVLCETTDSYGSVTTTEENVTLVNSRMTVTSPSFSPIWIGRGGLYADGCLLTLKADATAEPVTVIEGGTTVTNSVLNGSVLGNTWYVLTRQIVRFLMPDLF